MPLETEWKSMIRAYGLQHVGFTVPDMDEAVNFFETVLGASTIMECGSVDVDAEFMKRRLGVPEGYRISDQRVLQVGNSGALELFQYTGTDEPTPIKHNGEVGAMHIAFEVEDAFVAAERLRLLGVDVLDGPTQIDGGPMDGLIWLYFRTPWGQFLEIVSTDQRSGNEKTEIRKMYSPRLDPAAGQ